MKTQIIKSSIFCIALAAIFHVSFAREGNRSGSRSDNSVQTIAAGCSPPSSSKELDINNVRALILAGGDLWWDYNLPRYEIPKGSGNASLYTGALWLGGKDVSGQLKVAAMLYGTQGKDFWTGPLNTITSEIPKERCSDFDKHYLTTREMVSKFRSWYQAGLNDKANNTNTQQDKFPGYKIPKEILEWPAHGRNYPPYNEDYYLAPFYDQNGDGIYNPLDGDYPWYDLKGDVSCNTERLVQIYGDQNIWWIFNDKGNAHTQTGNVAIGMEIRAQAFAFTTNDEVNNMTFYNYQLINRSTYTLTDTYFGVFADTDIGCYKDDYVGCDVGRGLGFCYNGDENDEDCFGAKGYGSQPPAIGFDFFQGPYQDNDGKDNPLVADFRLASDSLGIPYKGIGVGYGDKIPDNERLGMRKFLYFNPMDDPRIGQQFYNRLRGYWNDNTRMVYGGSGKKNGCLSGTGATGFTCVPADYMFPGDSDPLGWGIGGNTSGVGPWTENNSGTYPDDRRFVQSSGPFTLGPGANNNITFGVVWARATTGGAEASVALVKKADDKTQAMFDNCFKVNNGPDAPDLTFRELDKEIIVYITNKGTSNNLSENYSEKDLYTIAPDSSYDAILKKMIALTPEQKVEYVTYYFQGYKVYQVKDSTVGPQDLKNPEKARLLFQCDKKDNVLKLINHTFDIALGANVPELQVEGANLGLTHSFVVKEDAFAIGNKLLVNHKKYYFMPIAYGANISPYAKYDPAKDGIGETKQKAPYIGSRKMGDGSGIKTFGAIPHKNTMEFNGVFLKSRYGDELEITKLEGTGNGGNFTVLKKESLDKVAAAAPWKAEQIAYQKGGAPVSIKIVDPLNVPPSDFYLRLIDSLVYYYPITGSYGGYWWHVWESGKEGEGVFSDRSVNLTGNEQLMLKWGLSLSVRQVKAPRSKKDDPLNYQDGYIGATIAYADSSIQWLSGVEDKEGFDQRNWILAGTANGQGDTTAVTIYPGITFKNSYKDIIDAGHSRDSLSIYEKLLNGTIAPFALCAERTEHGPAPVAVKQFTVITPPSISTTFDENKFVTTSEMKYLQSVDIIFTSDKSKWTRCPVLEMQPYGVLSELSGGGVMTKSVVPSIKYTRGFVRKARSLDKNGNNGGADLTTSSDPNHPNFISPWGMSWFPGYAVNVETGERLNMAFGEDTWLKSENGADMIWNPTNKEYEEPFIPGFIENWRMGGKHYYFVFRNNVVEEEFCDPTVISSTTVTGGGCPANPTERMPAYDYGKFIHTMLTIPLTDVDTSNATVTSAFRNVYRACMWVGFPLLTDKKYNVKSGEFFFPPTETKLSIRVTQPFDYNPSGPFVSVGKFDKPVLSVGKYYFVDKGPVIYKGIKYSRGQTFLTDLNTNCRADSLTAGNNPVLFGDTLNNLIQTSWPESNIGRPLYSFSTKGLEAVKDSNSLMVDALKLINVVPNPYYSYSEYEKDKLDNRVKIINLPRMCTVTIYSPNGTLIRQYKKDDPTITSLDWDLKNHARVPVASGVYLIHVEVPDVGERILKWFGILRPIDLDSF